MHDVCFNASKLSSHRRYSGYAYLAFLQFSHVVSTQDSFPDCTAFPFLSLAHLCSYRSKQALCTGISANCQLVNLIGLSPWVLFLNQLGNELAVTSLAEVGHLETHHPREVKGPNGKMLTSAVESYHVLRLVAYFFIRSVLCLRDCCPSHTMFIRKIRI